ncbi:response regulator transcription factor [Catenovulum sp. 2E275]|uniref:helix-turn-helix transcriptional regulator n=1 Tax=Catenovulum sp. 2E275 TaxID=2980497 RepID=UPI0021D03CAC|nr:response regulator transcription factor [Catenovulum sp. 2E275]MCU4676842.1 response regulator transcription factor [Catenovulum sp. 2E275]
MKRHIFITEKDLVSPRWEQACPVTQIIAQSKFVPNFQDTEICWILAGIPQWLNIIQEYSEQGTPVIVMTKMLSVEELCQALEAGARGYLEALSSRHIIEQASITILSGALWIPSGLLANLVGRLAKNTPASTHKNNLISEKLTKRESEVANQVVTGKSNKQVAQTLNITERTVKEHLSSIFYKLNVKDRMHLMLLIKQQ